MKMRKIIIITILLLPLVFNVECKKYAQKYPFERFQSTWLQKPESVINFARNSADFWKKTYDSENGGYFTQIIRNGNINNIYYKMTLSQTKLAYAFSRAYMITGDKEYLKYANYAAQFLITKCYDKKNGGFHTLLDAKGNNIDLVHDKLLQVNHLQKAKWSFIQHYALLGLTALVDATRDKKYFDFLVKSRALLDEKLYDNRKGLEGYYEAADYDWKNPRNKGFTPTLDGITTHGLSLYLLTNDQKYKKRLISLADNIIEHMYPTSKEREIGYDESYDTNWKSNNRSYIMIGNMLQTAWCLQRVNLISPKEKYSYTAEKIMKNIYIMAWDKEHGGPYFDADSVRGVVANDHKNYWTLEQGITSGLLNHYVTDNPLYLKMADESAAFFQRYIVDNEYGDIFDMVEPNGERIHDDDEKELKGSYFKSAYHSLETAYYVYLYTNLFYYKKDVRLYYNIKKSAKARTFPMNPIPEMKRLIISKVELNGKLYTKFDEKKRLLTIPAGTEGEFKVTYAIRE